MKKWFFVWATVLASVLLIASMACARATPAPAPAAAPTPAPATPKPKVKWDISTVQVQGSWFLGVLNDFAQQVSSRTGGGLDIVVHPAAELYKGTEILRVLRDRLLPASELLPPYITGDEHPFGWSSLPFLVGANQIDEVGARVDKEVLLPLLDEKWNTQVLWRTYSYTQQIITAKPLRTLDDLKGLKIRVASRELAAVLEKAGASSIFMPMAEAVPALERGTVDAISTGWSGIVEWKIYDIVKNVSVADLYTFPIFWAVNKQALAELPGEYRDVLLQVSREFDQRLKASWQAQELELRKVAEQKATVVNMDPKVREQLIALAKPVWEEWAKANPLSRKALDVALAALKK